MCTRYYIDGDATELLSIIRAAEQSPLGRRFLEAGVSLVTKGEVRPTDVAAVIATSRNRKKTVFPMQWGYRLPGATGAGSLLLNARTETAAEKKTFAEGWRSHRCAIPASWYLEWEHFLSPSGRKQTGDKFMIHPRDASLTWLCGLYRMEGGLPRFVVLTREPSESVAAIHDRMPLMLPERLIDRWIDPDTKPSELVPFALTDLIAERAG